MSTKLWSSGPRIRRCDRFLNNKRTRHNVLGSIWGTCAVFNFPKRTSLFWPSREFKGDHVCAISGTEASKRDDRHGEPFVDSGKQCIEKREAVHGSSFRELAMIKK